MQKPLFEEGDKATIHEVRKALGEIARSAHGADGVELQEDVLHLVGGTVNLFDPAVTFPNRREAYTIEAFIIVEATLLEPKGPSDRQVQITTRITASTWTMKASILFEADPLAATWESREVPECICSDRKLALAGLQAVARQSLIFSPLD